MNVTYLFVCGIIINFAVFAFSFNQTYHSDKLDKQSSISLIVSETLVKKAHNRLIISHRIGQNIDSLLRLVQNTQVITTIDSKNLIAPVAVNQFHNSGGSNSERWKVSMPFPGQAELSNLTMNGKNPSKIIEGVEIFNSTKEKQFIEFNFILDTLATEPIFVSALIIPSTEYSLRSTLSKEELLDIKAYGYIEGLSKITANDPEYNNARKIEAKAWLNHSIELRAYYTLEDTPTNQKINDLESQIRKDKIDYLGVAYLPVENKHYKAIIPIGRERFTGQIELSLSTPTRNIGKKTIILM